MATAPEKCRISFRLHTASLILECLLITYAKHYLKNGGCVLNVGHVLRHSVHVVSEKEYVLCLKVVEVDTVAVCRH